MAQRKIKLTPPKVRTIDPRFVAKVLGAEIVPVTTLTKVEALEFLRLVEEQRNAEQVERTRKLRIKSLMKKAGTQSPVVLENLIRRLVKS